MSIEEDTLEPPSSSVSAIQDHKVNNVHDGVWMAVASSLGLLIAFVTIRQLWLECQRIRQRRNAHHRDSTVQEPRVAVSDLPRLVYGGSGSEGADDTTVLAPLECMVCLEKVEEGDEMRVLPNCNHMFHVDCVDVWLRSHSTCPLCRTGVAPPQLVVVGVSSLQ